MNASLKCIGHINTPYEAIEECPNNVNANGSLCQLVLNDEFKGGLSGLGLGQKILILYWFENVDRNEIESKTGDGSPIGIFALRSPHRPNPIAAAILPIESIDDGVVSVRGLDCLNGTPLLDIKPAIMFESHSENR